MIIDTVKYVTLINLTEMECNLFTSTKEVYMSLCMCFRIFNFGQITMIFCGDENFKYCYIANVNVYKSSNLTKTDNYFRTNCYLVIH